MKTIKKLSDITLQDLADQRVIYKKKFLVKEFLKQVEGNIHIRIGIENRTETLEWVWINKEDIPKMLHVLPKK